MCPAPRWSRTMRPVKPPSLMACTRTPSAHSRRSIRSPVASQPRRPIQVTDAPSLAGQIAAAMPLQWENQTPITTGQVGGGPWIISRHSTNLATAANFVEWATTIFNPSGTNMRPGYPAYGPLATQWLAMLAKNPYFASDPGPALQAAAPLIWKGWDLVTYPDQPVWSNTVITGLVAGKSLNSLMPTFGSALAQAAQAAGDQVTR